MSETSAVRVYTPESSLAQPRLLVSDMLRDLAACRELAWQLATRDIRAQYRQALLGLVWAFLAPLLTALTWIFLRRAGVVSVTGTGIPYPLYVFSGTILWAIFVEAIGAPLNQTALASQMLARVNFPREAIVLSGIYQATFNAGIKLVLLAAAVALARVTPGWSVLLVPLGVAVLILVGTSLGLLLTPIGTLYSDVRKALPIVMGFAMFLTPVVYAAPRQGWVATLMEINPISSLIVTTRNWLTGMPVETLPAFATVGATSVVVLVVAWIGYRLAMPILIERMSA